MREQMKSGAMDQDGDQVDFSGSGGVVFDHLTRISKQIDEMLRFRRKSYENITDNHIIQKYILSEFADVAMNVQDDDIRKLSEKVAKADAEKKR